MILNPGSSHCDPVTPFAPFLTMADYPTPGTEVGSLSNNPAVLS